MTERLYYDDPWALSFRSHVVEHSTFNEQPSLVLEQTAFYPESGGQMADRGTLQGLDILDVQLDDDGRIHHVYEGMIDPEVRVVDGRVDWRRRRTHMSLHTGQHMLSRALFDILDADTLSSRLGENSCTIDLGIAPPSDAELAKCEDLVNTVVEEDRAIRAFFPEPKELDEMAMRRAPKVAGAIRVVEIPDFDITPCGGTHCTRTGQVSMVRLEKVERYKGGSRISFSAGYRAHQGLRRASDYLESACSVFGCAPSELVSAIEKRSRELKDSRQALGQVRAELAVQLATDLERQPENLPIIAALPGLGAEALRIVARRLTGEGSRVALLATTVGDSTHVLALRGPESGFDCGTFLRRASELGGGKGGGRPDRAEGRMPANINWEQVAAEAVASLV